MSRIIRADYGQSLLLPPDLNDWLPADHPARFIRDFVDALELDALGFNVPLGRTGKPAFAAEMLLKIWLHGYYHKIRSTRGLERACYDSISLRWLTGNHQPDHNTLWRFWDKNRSAFKAVFKSSVRVAVGNGLVSLALQAVDGTKIRAQVSTARADRREELEKLLARLDEAIAEIEQEVESREQSEGGSYRLPPELIDAQQRREGIARALEEMKEAGCDCRHACEPEARVMICREGKRLGYNAQIVSEEDNGLIVASEVTDGANDFGQLGPMLESARETVGEVAAETLADSGYWSGEDLDAAERNETEVLVASRRAKDEGPYGKSAFRYDAEGDLYVCPHGEKLEFMRLRKTRGGRESRVYRCRNRTCPYRSECSSDPKGRTVERMPFEEAVERQKEKQSCPENRVLMSRRKEIAEPPFARVKEALGFRRWTVRGLEKVRAQWALMCTTVNLRTLHGYWKRGDLEMGGA